MILRNFSLLVEPGQTVALVGQSGSGKSTIIGLLERFYDLLEGEVLVDDVPVKDWNLTSLRDQIGLVQQVCMCRRVPQGTVVMFRMICSVGRCFSVTLIRPPSACIFLHFNASGGTSFPSAPPGIASPIPFRCH